MLPRSVLGRSTLGNGGLRLCWRPFPAPAAPAGSAGRGGDLRAASAEPPLGVTVSCFNKTAFPIGLSPSCGCHTPGRSARSQTERGLRGVRRGAGRQGGPGR